MNKIQEFILERGGTAKVSREIDRPQSTVSTWIARGAIPLDNWERFAKVGVPWERMLDLHKASVECDHG